MFSGVEGAAMKVRYTYTGRFFGKERVIVVRKTKAGYPYKDDYRKLKEALKDGCWWVKGEETPRMPNDAA